MMVSCSNSTLLSLETTGVSERVSDCPCYLECVSQCAQVEYSSLSYPPPLRCNRHATWIWGRSYGMLLMPFPRFDCLTTLDDPVVSFGGVCCRLKRSWTSPLVGRAEFSVGSDRPGRKTRADSSTGFTVGVTIGGASCCWCATGARARVESGAVIAAADGVVLTASPVSSSVGGDRNVVERRCCGGGCSGCGGSSGSGTCWARAGVHLEGKWSARREVHKQPTKNTNGEREEEERQRRHRVDAHLRSWPKGR